MIGSSKVKGFGENRQVGGRVEMSRSGKLSYIVRPLRPFVTRVR
jgi:hypothetical protein